MTDPSGSSTFPPDVGDLYQDVLAETGDLVAVVDRELRYVAANTAHLTAHETPLESLVGRTVPEQMGADVYESALRPHYERALAGEATRFEGWFHLPAAGRRYYTVSLRPRRSADGEVIGLVIIVRDLTDREEAAESVRRSRARLALALSAARMGIWEWDVVRNVLDWSDEALRHFGVDRDGFEGTYEAFLAFLHPDDYASVTEAVTDALQDPGAGDTYSVEYRIFRPDGPLRWQLAQGQVLRDDDAKPRRMIGVVTDITRRKELEARLSLAEKLQAVGRLAGGVAHDFNNILTGVMGEAFLASHESRSSSVQQRLEAIVTGCERAATLTKRLLAFARKQPAKSVSTSIEQVIDAMSVLLRWTVKDPIKLTLDLQSGLSAVLAAPAQIEQVVLNLVTNAREAMDGAGEITISTREVDPVPGLDPFAGTHGARVIVLDVQDTGPGIDADVLEHIFEPFFTTRGTLVNSGLGLATCYGIVEQLGGTIQVADPRPGRTTFEVRLPTTTESPREETASPARKSAPAGEHILLVEDDQWVREVTAHHLSTLGYRVTACASAMEALRRCPEPQDVDLLLTDIMMPEINGAQLASTFRQTRPDLPVLLISGLARPEGAGFPFLQKPFTRQQLAEALQSVLRG